jgi:Ankyrin repeats (many copies)/Ankyrin repeats (3 copies)
LFVTSGKLDEVVTFAMTKNREIELPPELWYRICENTTLKDYIALRRSSRNLRRLEEVPTLSFDAYERSTFIYGKKLRNVQRMKLDCDHINDTTFNFVAGRRHFAETIRILTSPKSQVISDIAKEGNYLKICEKGTQPPGELILAFLREGKIDPYIAQGIVETAAKCCNEELLQLVIKHHSFRYIVSKEASNATRLVAIRGSVPCFKIFSDNHRWLMVDVCREEWTLLHYTAKYGRTEIVGMILDDGVVDLNHTNLRGDTAAMLAVDQGKHEILSLFLKNERFNPHLENDMGQNLLHLAAARNSKKTLQLLLQDERFDPNAMDYNKQTPLHAAAEKGMVGCVSLLLTDLRVDPNHKDVLRQQAVYLAKAKGHTDVVKRLLANPRVKPELDLHSERERI